MVHPNPYGPQYPRSPRDPMNEPYGGYSHEQRGQLDGYGQPFEAGPVDQWGRYNPHGPNAYATGFVPHAYAPVPAEKNQTAVAALVVGLCSFAMVFIAGPFALLLGICGIICGIMGITNSRRFPGSNGMGMAITGLIASIISTLMAIAFLAFMALAIYELEQEVDSGTGSNKGPESSSESVLERTADRDRAYKENT